MPRTRIIRETEAIAALEVFANKPHGITKHDLCTTLDWDPHRATRAIRTIRETCAQTDTINLICEPNGPRQPWLYKLVGTLDDARPWSGTRAKAIQSQLETWYHVHQSIARGSDGRTIEGRAARAIERHLGRLLEDLQEIRDGDTLPYG